MAKVMWLDIEGTGFSPKKDKITEIGMIFDDTKTGESDEFQIYVYHDEYPDGYEDMVNKYLKNDNLLIDNLKKNGVSFVEARIQFLDFLHKHLDPMGDGEKAYIYGYNVKFDISHIKNYFQDNDHYYRFFINPGVCVLETAKTAINKGCLTGIENKKLPTVCKYLDISLDAHSALDDIKATKKVQIELKKRIKAVGPVGGNSNFRSGVTGSLGSRAK